MILTGSADFETAQRPINESGAFRYLTKPWHDVELGSHIEAALAHAALTRQQRQQAEQWRQQADAPTPQELERGAAQRRLPPRLRGPRRRHDRLRAG